MKNKLLIILALLLFVGCGKDNTKAEKIKNNPNDLSYYMVSYMTEKIDEDSTRIYAILENTSKNSGKIGKLLMTVVDEQNNLQYHDEKELHKDFISGEQIAVVFDAKISIDKVESILIIPLYENNKEIPFVNNQKKYNQIEVELLNRTIKELDNKNKVTIDIKFAKEQKINKLKVEVNSASGYPTCIAYIDINKTVKKDKKYTYTFECESGINIDGYTTFEV